MRPETHIRLLAGLLSIGSIVVVAACGSADPAPASDPLKEFVGNGDRICKAALRANPPPTVAPKDSAEALDYGEQELATRERTQAELQDLTPPAELRETVDGFHSRTSKVVDLLARQNEAAKDDDEKRYGEVAVMLEAAFEQREKEAKTIGYEICGQRVKPRSGPGGAGAE